MKTILQQLTSKQPLTRAEACQLLLRMTGAYYSETEIAAILMVYLMRPITGNELQGFKDAMMAQCVNIAFNVPTVDIVGSGGDGKNTFNISTLACFVTAACGVPVTKHGNYGASSVSGSSNVLERIGIRFTNQQETLQMQLETAGICFLHAPLFHPAMQAVAPVRKALGLRTFFNLLGPLVNPAQPAFRLIGTCNLATARLYRQVLEETRENYTLVHTTDGYDEITLTAPFKVWTSTTEQSRVAADLNLPTVAPSTLYGGTTPEAAADLFLRILKGRGSPAQASVVAINAAYAIAMVTGENIEMAYQRAFEALQNGAAYNTYQLLLQTQHKTHEPVIEHHRL